MSERDTIESLRERVAKAERRAIMFGDVISNHCIAMQAAVIEQLAGAGAKAAMAWIQNTLLGPGLLPDVEAAAAMGGAQAWFDAKSAEHEAFRAAHAGPMAPYAAFEEGSLPDILAAARALVAAAERVNAVVTISTVPLPPLRMSNYRHQVDVRLRTYPVVAQAGDAGAAPAVKESLTAEASVLMDVTLDDEMTALLCDTITGGDQDRDTWLPVRFIVGNGAAGHGLYVCLADYPEEGAILLAEVAAPPQPPAVPAQGEAGGHGWVTEFCARYSGEQMVKAGDVLDFLMRLPLSKFAPSVERQPLSLSEFREWFARRLNACGPTGVTDQADLAEEVMRWTETRHGITFTEEAAHG